MRLTLTKDEILNGNLLKGLIKITIPLIILNLINTLYGIVDTYFIGKIGELQVGAVAIISPITACGTAFTEGLCAAGISLISRSLGKGNKEIAGSVAKHLVILCILLGLLIGILTFTCSKYICLYLNTPTDIFYDTQRYLIGISFDFIFLFIISMYQAIRQAHGDSKSGVILNASAAIMNCILDPIFIFSLNLGTLGAALATAISKMIVTPIALYKLFNNEDSNFLINAKIKSSTFFQIVKVALPSSIGHFLSSFGFVLMSKEIAAYGSIAMSAYGIGSNIANIYYIFVNCWGIGLATFVGTSLGAEKKERASSSFKTSMYIVAFVSLLFIPLGFLTSKTMINLLIKNASDKLISEALTYTYFSIFTAFCMGWFNNLNGVFDGSANTLISMILQGSRIWAIRIPLIKLFNHITTLGVTNIWIAMCVSNLIVCIIGTILYKYYPWKNNKLKLI